MVYVPESALDAKAADAVRRLAAFANPEFYRAQAMHHRSNTTFSLGNRS